MADIIQVAEQLNKQVNQLNNERSKLEGMLETSKLSYEKAVADYKAKYGVDLTEENLQEEYNAIYAKTKGAILDLQEKIESIKRGDYKKNVETVEYELEPDVEPVRQEVVEDKPKKTRGRKSTKKSDVKEEEPETAPVVEETLSQVSEPSDEDPEIKVDNTSLDFNFSGFEDIDNPSPTKEEVVKTPKVEEKTTKKSKTLSAADLAELNKAVESQKVAESFPEMSLEEDDEVPLKDTGVKTSVETPESDDVIKDFHFGDLSSFGADMGEPEQVKSDKEIPEVPSFGGFGDLVGFEDVPEEPKEEKKEEKKEESITPEGWGSSDNVGFDFSGLDDLFKSGNATFGE